MKHDTENMKEDFGNTVEHPEGSFAMMVPSVKHGNSAHENDFSESEFLEENDELIHHVAKCARFLPQDIAEKFGALVIDHTPNGRYVFSVALYSPLTVDKKIEFARFLEVPLLNISFKVANQAQFNALFAKAYSRLYQAEIKGNEDRKSTQQTKGWGKTSEKENYGRRAGDLHIKDEKNDEASFDDIFNQRIDLTDLDEYERNIRKSEEALTIEEFARLALMEFVRSGASDFHTECGRDKGHIRFRFDGLLYSRWEDIPFHDFSKINNAIAVMAGIDFSEMKRQSVDSVLKMRVNLKGKVTNVEYRFTSQPSQPLPSITLRAQNEPIREFNKIGLIENQIKDIIDAIDQPQGINIVTGPTGGGKTNTLEAMYALLEKPRNKKIIEIADPVEIESEWRTQISLPRRQPGGKRPIFTWFDAFASSLRADPDVMGLGELRSTESAKVALDASLTGHLVLATLHASNVEATFTRLFEMGIPRDLLADGLNLICSQRLVRLLCKFCKKPEENDGHIGGSTTYKNDPNGCRHCAKGFKGRTAIAEVLLVNGQVKKWIRAKHNAASIVQRALHQNLMTSMQDVANHKVAMGLTSRSEVNRVLTLNVEIMDSPDFVQTEYVSDVIDGEWEEVK